MTTLLLIAAGYLVCGLFAGWCFGRFGRDCDVAALRALQANSTRRSQQPTELSVATKKGASESVETLSQRSDPLTSTVDRRCADDSSSDVARAAW